MEENILKIENMIEIESEKLPKDKYKNSSLFKKENNELGYANYLFLGLTSGLMVIVLFIIYMIN